MDQPLLIKLIRSVRKTMALQVMRNGVILVKAPFWATRREVDLFIKNNNEWIEKQQQKVGHSSQRKKREYMDGETFLYLGKEVILHIGTYAEIAVVADQLRFPSTLQFRIQKELTTWYIKQAKKIITERLGWYSKAMKLSYGQVTFSDTKSRWGSCAPNNDLQFNWRLIMAPLLTLNYVVVHELVHTIEKNHSRDFYSRVRYYSPTYKIQREWLKKHGETLVV